MNESSNIPKKALSSIAGGRIVIGVCLSVAVCAVGLMLAGCGIDRIPAAQKDQFMKYALGRKNENPSMDDLMSGFQEQQTAETASAAASRA